MDRKNYSFNYYPSSILPGGNRSDLYGFYNGIDAFNEEFDFYKRVRIASGYVNDPTTRNLYYTARQPNSNAVKSELLSQVNYPTGGYTLFEYEANDYSSYVKSWPFQVAVNPANTTETTSGIRIWKTRDYDSNNNLLESKTYYYRKNYAGGGTQSSGVLAYKPVFFEDWSGSESGKTYTLHRISSTPVAEMNIGNHISYSEVAEVLADNSFTVYKYKNHDNGYQDQEPLGYAAMCKFRNFWEDTPGISMELERGQLLSKEIYDASNNIKKRIKYQYNDDSSRFNTHVRQVAYTLPSTRYYKAAPTPLLVSRYIYTYHPYLKSEEEIKMLSAERKERYYRQRTFTPDVEQFTKKKYK